MARANRQRASSGSSICAGANFEVEQDPPGDSSWDSSWQTHECGRSARSSDPDDPPSNGQGRESPVFDDIKGAEKEVSFTGVSLACSASHHSLLQPHGNNCSSAGATVHLLQSTSQHPSSEGAGPAWSGCAHGPQANAAGGSVSALQTESSSTQHAFSHTEHTLTVASGTPVDMWLGELPPQRENCLSFTEHQLAHQSTIPSRDITIAESQDPFAQQSTSHITPVITSTASSPAESPLSVGPGFEWSQMHQAPAHAHGSLPELTVQISFEALAAGHAGYVMSTGSHSTPVTLPQQPHSRQSEE